MVEPSLKAAWEHEYKYSALPITAGFAEFPGPSATFFGPSEGHDSAMISAGVSSQLTPAVTVYVNYDGQLGRGNYEFQRRHRRPSFWFLGRSSLSLIVLVIVIDPLA